MSKSVRAVVNPSFHLPCRPVAALCAGDEDGLFAVRCVRLLGGPPEILRGGVFDAGLEVDCGVDAEAIMLGGNGALHGIGHRCHRCERSATQSRWGLRCAPLRRTRECSVSQHLQDEATRSVPDRDVGHRAFVSAVHLLAGITGGGTPTPAVGKRECLPRPRDVTRIDRDTHQVGKQNANGATASETAARSSLTICAPSGATRGEHGHHGNRARTI